MTQRVIIVGAGQAGCQVAISLRQGKYDGEILLLGKEPWTPYQRPPLSKQVLKDGWTLEKCQLRSLSFFESNNIEIRTGCRVESIDDSNQRVLPENGEPLDYDHLVICTGSRLNRIQLTDKNLAGTHYLRTFDDALAIRDSLTHDTRLAIIGAGYIGLEVAASARSLGCRVDVIEAQDQIMKRSALPPIAEVLETRHRNEGVNIHLGRQVTEIHGAKHLEAISLDDGTRINSDVLLTGIGVRPDLRWLANSGIKVNRGVVVDRQCRTNIKNVFAAGDCAECSHPAFPEPIVLESVQNAVDQGKVAASNILGIKIEYTQTPWFWSEQFDLRFQMAGLPQPGDEMVLRNTNPGTVSVLSLGRNQLNAIQCLNNPMDFMCGRKLIAIGESVDMDRLRDPDTGLKQLL